MKTTKEVLYQRPIPQYIIMSEKWYTDKRMFDQNFRKAIFDGSLGYEQVATFENIYLWPKKTIFSIASRPRKKSQLISPKIIVLEKK